MAQQLFAKLDQQMLTNIGQQLFKKLDQQKLTKIGQQMFKKLDQQMLTKIGQQMFHTIETDSRQAGVNQQMFLTYTIEIADGHTIEGRRPFVTPDRFFCLSQLPPLYHYLYTSPAPEMPEKPQKYLYTSQLFMSFLRQCL